MRITTVDDPAQRPRGSQHPLLVARAHAGQGVLGQGDHAPVRRPVQTSQAMGLRQTLAPTTSTRATSRTRSRWQDATETSLASITATTSTARTPCSSRALRDTADADRRATTIAAEIDQIINGIKESANAKLGDNYLMSGTKTDVAAVPAGRRRHLPGRRRGLGPGGRGRAPRDRPRRDDVDQHGRAASSSARAGHDGKLLDTLRDISEHLNAPATAPRCAAAT